MSLQIAPVPRALQLKDSVDIQLDHAFHDELWTIAANLARQRHRATKDEYYKVRLIVRFSFYPSSLLLHVHTWYAFKIPCFVG